MHREGHHRRHLRVLSIVLLATLASACSAVASEASSSVPSLVRDINHGSSSSAPHRFASIGDRLLFNANDGVHGVELWVSDGTSAGTHLVKDINPGGASSDPYALNRAGSKVFFRATDPSHGAELWASNGTAAGTHLVKDINPGPEGSDPRHGMPSAPNYFIRNVNGRPYFNAYDPAHGYEPWTSNGTARGTHLVKDVLPGNRTSDAADFTYANGTVFFSAEGQSFRRTLWRTDGTASGTHPVMRSNGAPVYYPSYLTNFDGSLFFSAGTSTGGALKLTRSDGTPAGTKPVVPNGPGAYNLRKAGGTLFFAGQDSHGTELWGSDGTAAGTRLIKDIDTNDPDWGGSYPNELTDVGGRVFFEAHDRTHGFELWRSDGTPAGTALVRDIRPGTSESRVDCLTAVGQTLFFKAYNDSSNRDDLWRSDGTAAGTTRVKPNLDCTDGTLRNVAGTLFFSAFDNRGVELWKVAP
jgi:ELWxxDGT repeat protein